MASRVAKVMLLVGTLACANSLKMMAPRRLLTTMTAQPYGSSSSRLTSGLAATTAAHAQQTTAGDLQAAEALLDWLKNVGGPVVTLTGAGISTDSGVPDYRGPNGSYSRGHKPMQHDAFISSHRQRQRYWSRSAIGWRWFSAAEPNAAHLALARLEAQGVVASVVTQNVDGLHQRAGSQNVVDLHGINSRTICLDCNAFGDRARVQRRLEELNAGWLAAAAAQESGGGGGAAQHDKQRADGDAELGVVDEAAFQLCACDECGGVIKPDVIFFGDNVPLERVKRCFDMVERASGLLVVGTSLAVYSGYRFVEAAAKQGKPIAIVNLGPTRAEKAGLPGILKLDAGCGTVLSAVADAWEGGGGFSAAQ